MSYLKKNLLLILLFSPFLYLGCDNNDDVTTQEVDGIYKGTLTSVIASKDNLTSKNASSDATAEILTIGKNKLQIHCFSAALDTTFLMNFYHHKDSVYVCYTGADFKNAYGHMLGGGHMGGMMDDKRGSETEWTHHMNDEHNKGDKHYGGFNMSEQTFDYMFAPGTGHSSDYMKFHGVRRK